MLGIQEQALWALTLSLAKQGKTKSMLYLDTKTFAANNVTYIREPLTQRKMSPSLAQITKTCGIVKEGFQFKTDCLLCSKQVTLGKKRTQLEQAHKVMTIKFKDVLLEACRDMMVGNIL